MQNPFPEPNRNTLPIALSTLLRMMIEDMEYVDKLEGHEVDNEYSWVYDPYRDRYTIAPAVSIVVRRFPEFIQSSDIQEFSMPVNGEMKPGFRGWNTRWSIEEDLKRGLYITLKATVGDLGVQWRDCPVNRPGVTLDLLSLAMSAVNAVSLGQVTVGISWAAALENEMHRNRMANGQPSEEDAFSPRKAYQRLIVDLAELGWDPEVEGREWSNDYDVESYETSFQKVQLRLFQIGFSQYVENGTVGDKDEDAEIERVRAQVREKFGHRLILADDLYTTQDTVDPWGEKRSPGSSYLILHPEEFKSKILGFADLLQEYEERKHGE